ncbi:hypothetical protein L2E82_12487 [Cichorium intybus]|uniref:Uncharacterized protein n=1 Tax=Cichorium intybus TaxID=13427 RepID=A0ACB9GH87_CICIN|nr:hypothetical protein L2E82_12487 [Cichorium intybus]
MVLVDLRCHGNSTDREGLSPPHDTANAARDLANLVKSLDWAWPDIVIGHSLGGKVALQYALSCAQGDYGDSAKLPKQVWVLDCVPGKVENKSQYQELEKALHALLTLPSPIPSQEYEETSFPFVDSNKKDVQIRQVNLNFSPQPKFGLVILTQQIDHGVLHTMDSWNEGRNLDSDYWSLLEEPPKGMEIAIVRTESQLTWNQDVVERLESLASRESDESRGKVSVYVVPHSGHWIYKDNPERLLEIMTPSIASLVQLKL